MDRHFALIAGAVALIFSTDSAKAVTVLLGVENFTDKQVVSSANFTNSVSAQDAPFNGINGNDTGATNFSVSFTFNYAAVPVTSAQLSIGIWDGDFDSTASQLATFTVDGISVATLAKAVLAQPSTTNNLYRVCEIDLPLTTFALLADGSATVALSLQGPGQGVLGATTSNGAGINFAKLTLNTVPEPSPAVSLAALALCGLLRHRRSGNV